ncbi:MAG: hypothetical protein WAL86_04145 [Candidatus Acidiferrales bacterium]
MAAGVLVTTLALFLGAGAARAQDATADSTASDASKKTSQPAGSTPPAISPATTPSNSSQQPESSQRPPSPTDQQSTAASPANDRVFLVMPNYATVENASQMPPLSTGQKFKIAGESTFDPFVYPFVGVQAAIAQAQNSPKSLGQGWGPYAQRYGTAFGDGVIGTFMTVTIFPSALHQDPRYYQLGRGSFIHRALYSASRLAITRGDDGSKEFNTSEFAGNAVDAAFSNIYHVQSDRTVSRTLTTWVVQIGWDGVSNELKEFWPDIHKKFSRKSQVTGATGASAP